MPQLLPAIDISSRKRRPDLGKPLSARPLRRRNLDGGRRTLFIAPALSLSIRRLKSFTPKGFATSASFKADHEMTDWTKPVQIASVQTLMRRKTMPMADMVLIDEVHRKFDKYEQWPEWRMEPHSGHRTDRDTLDAWSR